MTIELVSFADIKSVINLEDAAITDYPGLGIIRDNVVFAIESYLSRYLENTDYTQSVKVMSKTKMIPLRALPVESISTVTVSTLGVDESLTEHNDYMITDYGILLDSSVNRSSVDVEYTGGYEAADVPNEIKRAAILQTIYEFQGKDTIGATSVSTEGGSVQTPALGLLKEVRRLLDPFKHQLAWS